MAPPTRILIVEDEPDIASLIKHALERRSDTEVQVVQPGAAALGVVGDRLPDLMILDLSLPGVDGTEVCRRVRSRAATAALPIIMLTARTSEPDRVAGLDLGAD